MQEDKINNTNEKVKFYKSKYEFDISLFNNQQFKTIPLPSSLNIEVHFNPFEKSQRVINTQIEWLKTCGFYNTEEELENVLKKQHLKLSSLFYPFLNETAFEFLVLIYEHGWLLDDKYFEKNKFSTMMEKYLERNSKDHDQIGKKYWELYDKYGKYGHPKNFEKLIKGNDCWTRSSVYANLHGNYNAEMTFEEYSEFRSKEVGPEYAASFVMTCEDEYIPDDIYESKDFQQIFKKYGTFGFLVNDLYSFKKEINQHSFANCVKLFAIQLGNIQDAIDKTYNLAIHHYKDLLSSIENLLILYPNEKAIQIFVPRMKQTVWGTYYCHLLCDRYLKN